MTWSVLESRDAEKALDKVQPEVKEKYSVWLAIVRVSGPVGLRPIRGFHDEALKGQWAGCRSSRLNQQFRVIYDFDSETQVVRVRAVTPHDYRR